MILPLYKIEHNVEGKKDIELQTCSSALLILLSLYFWLNKEAFLSNAQWNSSCLLVCCFGDAGKSVELDFSTVSSFDTCRAVRHLGRHGKRYFGTRITRYPNSVATFNLIHLTTSGDISLNPQQTAQTAQHLVMVARNWLGNFPVLYAKNQSEAIRRGFYATAATNGFTSSVSIWI